MDTCLSRRLLSFSGWNVEKGIGGVWQCVEDSKLHAGYLIEPQAFGVQRLERRERRWWRMES